MRAPNVVKFLRRIADIKTAKKLGELGISGYLLEMGWFNSAKQKASVDRNNNPIPWYTYPAFEFLNERLPGDINVFEYGSGNSTIYFSKRVKYIAAVEDNSTWVEMVSKKIPVEKGKIYYIPLEYDSTYCRASSTEGILYDLIIVDGRDRVNCFEKSIDFLSDAGVLILDDSEREQYKKTYDIAANAGFKHINFYGMAPGVALRKCTTIFYRTNNILGI